MEYNLFHLEDFLFRTAGGGLFTWIEIFGLEALPQELKKRPRKLNKKYIMLIEQARRYQSIDVD